MKKNIIDRVINTVYLCGFYYLCMMYFNVIF